MTSPVPWSARCSTTACVVRLLDGRGQGARPARPTRASSRLGSRTPGAAECELAVVIGGDGTILRAAELTHGTATPLLGVNLGHVGFLAEAESEDVETMIERDRRASLHQRGAADHRRRPSTATASSSRRTWALNEASVEKAARQRMLEVVVEVDGRPLSRFGLRRRRLRHADRLDGVQLQRRRPVVWPERRGAADGADQRPRAVRPAAWSVGADLGAGRRGAGPDPGSGRAVVRRPAHGRAAARARASRCAAAVRRSAWSGCTRRPFTDRLVAKFGLPVDGWRGSLDATQRAPATR